MSSWDAYPLGFLSDRSDQDENWKKRFLRTGDPDFQAFHHDLYRATSKGRWWIMEQQPGPVNWAQHNPAPRAGQVRLWTWEAFAHGAEVVSYFRWRQAPFAQEQMHAGLLGRIRSRPKASPRRSRWREEIAELAPSLDANTPAEVAIVFDYASAWAWEIQPQGQEFDYFRIVFDTYRALRRLGLSVDIVPATTAIFPATGWSRSPPCSPGRTRWSRHSAISTGSRSSARAAAPRRPTSPCPPSMPPGLPADLLDARVCRVETLPADCPVPVGPANFRFWREFVVPGPQARVILKSDDGWPALIRQGHVQYMAGWGDEQLLLATLQELAEELNIPTVHLPEGVRIRQSGGHLYAVNYGDEDFDLAALGIRGEPMLGEMTLQPSGVSILKLKP